MGGVKGYATPAKGAYGKGSATTYGAAGAWGKGKVQPTITKTPVMSTKGKGYSTTTYAPGFAPASWNSGAKDGSGWGKDASGWGKGGYGKGYGKDGKGKGKSSQKVAPPAGDPYWAQKVSAENRQEGDGSVYSGSIQNYNIRGGWGFVMPDDAASLPEDIQSTLLIHAAEAQARGKTVDDANLLYFRKPDLVEGFKAEKGVAVTFQVYTDDKGAGACAISPA